MGDYYHDLPRLNRREVWLSNVFQDPPPQQLETGEQASYWTRIMAGALPDEDLDEMLEIPAARCYLFCGPLGTGRKTVAVATAGSLGRLGYRFALLTASDFQGLDGETLRDCMEGLFELVRPGEPVCMVLDGVNEWENREQVCRLLAGGFARSKALNLPLFAILVAPDTESVGDTLLSQMTVCGFTPPGEEERTAFYREGIKDNWLSLKQGITALDLAKETEGLNYYQLKQTLYWMRLILKGEAVAAAGSTNPRAVREQLLSKSVRIDTEKFRAIVRRIRQDKPTPAQQIQVVPQPQLTAAAAYQMPPVSMGGVSQQTTVYRPANIRPGSAVDFSALKMADTMSQFQSALDQYAKKLDEI
ncbi:MAG: hypothetical protein IJD21_09215 [Oscillospiraceae bacterium]|nr:hypothetical protein [Oscillospiraceae bacterium]